ncbi:hypothetical protein H2198_010220, partial [Neophaeococcomyces mojaviensis]
PRRADRPPPDQHAPRPGQQHQRARAQRAAYRPVGAAAGPGPVQCAARPACRTGPRTERAGLRDLPRQHPAQHRRTAADQPGRTGPGRRHRWYQAEPLRPTPGRDRARRGL